MNIDFLFAFLSVDTFSKALLKSSKEFIEILKSAPFFKIGISPPASKHLISATPSAKDQRLRIKNSNKKASSGKAQAPIIAVAKVFTSNIFCSSLLILM